MAILAFQKPDKVVMLEASDKFGKFEFRPLDLTIVEPALKYQGLKLRRVVKAHLA